MTKAFHYLKFWHLPKKIWLIGLILLIIIGFIFRPKSISPTKYEYSDAKTTTLEQIVTGSGILTGKDSTNLQFKISGKIVSLPVTKGDTVKKGQLIASLDTQDLSIALQQAENNLRDKQAIVTKVLDDVKDSDTSETFTEAQTRTTAEVARDNAYDGVKAARRAFQDAVITTPISGIITQLPVKSGTNITAGQLVAEIVDFSEKVFLVDIDEYDISKVQVGMPAKITLNSYPDQIFNGTVSEIAPSTKTTSSGATVVEVKITLDPNLQPIKGLNGQADIITRSKPNVLAIPIDSLRQDNTVLLKTDTGFRTQAVTPGESSDSQVEITSGLQPGDQVMLNPPAPGQEQPKKFLGLF